jgi:hypothetical protein
MPSPFPGMDPFLESPDHFSDFHHSFIERLRDAIQPQITPKYYASTQTRAWLAIAERERPIIPDVDIRLKNPSLPRVTRKLAGRGGTAMVIQVPEPKVVKLPVEEMQETYVSIYARKKGGDQLVSSIEVLSPSNKIPGSDSRQLYLNKQQDLLDTTVNLVEIDLLRGGEHTTAVPKAHLILKVWPFDYHVCLHRSRQRGEFHIYDFCLKDQLPKIPIPLLPSDPDVVVDLQKVFRTSYAAAAFELRIDYRDVLLLTPPLQPEQLNWAVNLLRRRKLLPKKT